jgi:hypothetical protein
MCRSPVKATLSPLPLGIEVVLRRRRDTQRLPAGEGVRRIEAGSTALLLPCNSGAPAVIPRALVALPPCVRANERRRVQASDARPGRQAGVHRSVIAPTPLLRLWLEFPATEQMSSAQRALRFPRGGGGRPCLWRSGRDRPDSRTWTHTARGNRRPVARTPTHSRGRRLHAAQAMTTLWRRTSRPWRAGCSTRSSPRATACASIETTGQLAVTSAQRPWVGSPGCRPRTPRSWPKPTGNGGNPWVSRPTALMRSACKPRHSAGPFPVSENRGVPGSSPGLAIRRSAC